MKEEQYEQLENEVLRGQRAQRAYDEFIKDFIQFKKLTLFNNFCAVSINEPDKLMEARRLVTVLEDLESEILSITNSGKMAAKTLEGV
ncbi:hypothetical protein [Polynucleobacter sp.]|uniref:hypothetical protein n=1 Tax=Polynucleobacter sp. TaxID=2029855 RepID=UPI003F69B90D